MLVQMDNLIPTVYARLQSSDTLTSSNLAVTSAFSVDTIGPVVSNITVNQTPGTDNIVINYDLADNSGNNNLILLQISSNGGSTWTVPTTSLSGDVGTGVSSDVGKSVTWDAGIDFSNQENELMKVRILGTDRFGNIGSFVSSNNFTVDSKGPVVSAVSAVQIAGSSNVTINYSLSDLTASGNFVDVEISSNGGSTWVVPTSSLTGNVGVGQSVGNKTITWNAGVDFSGQSQLDMRVRVRARDYFANQGAYVQSSNFILDTAGPVVSNISAIQNIGSTNLVVTYDLSDQTTSSLNVELQISEDGGSSWVVPTTSVIGEVGVGQTTGNGKTITWMADTDFDGIYSNTMQVRVRAIDSFSNQGDFATTANFTLDTANPTISNVTANQTVGSDSVVIHYDLSDDSSTNILVQLDISSNNGSSWSVATSTLAGNIGGGQTNGVNKTITWNADVDFNNQDLGTLKIRARAIDKFTNQGNYAQSASFAVDSKNPELVTVRELSSHPQGGEPSVIINGSFTKKNPATTSLNIPERGGANGSATIGTGNTAVLNNQVVDTNTTLQGNDYISKLKIVETDLYNHSLINENISPTSVYKYVKPYTPAVPTVDNSTTTTVDIVVNKNSSEVSGLEYAIFENTTGKYVQADGTLGNNAVWQTGATWATLTVVGLSSPVSQYVFKTKSRNSSDVSHAVSSESSLSSGASAGNTAPTITVNSVSQTSGNNYVTINYSGTDLEANSVNLTTYQYSLNNVDWYTMTEKSGVGSNGVNNLIFSPTGTAYNFAWNAAADLSNVENAVVRIRLLANDTLLDGNLAIGPTFALDLKAPQIANVSASQNSASRQVTIEYDLADLTSTNLSVALDISSDNGTSWNVATTTLVGDIGNGQSVGVNKIISWNAGVDFNNQYNSTLKVRVRAIDNFANVGGNVESSVFVVDTLAPLISNISAEQTAGTNNVLVVYNLTDDSSINLNVALDISDDNGITWVVATSTVSGNVGSSQTTGFGKSISWNAGTDFAGQFSNNFKVRLRASDTFNNQSNNFSSELFTVDTQVPVVSSVVASQSSGSGVVIVSYSLTDSSASNNTVEIGISDNNGSTWNITTTSLSGDIGANQSSGMRTFVWNAPVDFSDQLQSDMKVRIKARDAFGNQGSFAQSSVFDLDTKAPVISNLSAVQTTSSNNINIQYDLVENTNTSTVSLEMSSDGGLNWTVTAVSLTGGIGATTDGLNKTITWSAGTDFANQEKNNMRVRLHATDSFGNLSSNFSSSDFVLDTKAPVGLITISKFTSATSSVTLNWSAGVTDANFDHYEIWHGANENDVNNRSGSALNWNVTNDSALSNVLTISTVITGISTDVDYFVKIFAIDSYGHESTINRLQVFQTAVAPTQTPISITGGGGGFVAPIIARLSRPILNPVTSPTTQTKITISGLTDPRTRVDLYDKGTLVERFSSVADNNGEFSQSFTFTQGTHSLVVRAVDFNNNVSSFSDPVNFTIVATLPEVPVASEVVNITPTSVTVRPIPLVVPVAPAATLESIAIPPASLIRINTEAVEVPGLPVPKVGNVVIPSTDIAEGNENIITVTIPTNVAINDVINFSGSALPNQDVIVYVHSEQGLIFRTRTNDKGVWEINHSQGDVELTPGDHTIFAVAIDPVSKVKSRPSAVTMFTVKRNLWVTMFKYLNIQTTLVSLGVLLITILWLYRINKKELAP